MAADGLAPRPLLSYVARTDGHAVVAALGGLLVIVDGKGRETCVSSGEEAAEVVRGWFVEYLEDCRAQDPETFDKEFSGLIERAKRASEAVPAPGLVTSLKQLQSFGDAVGQAARTACATPEERELIEDTETLGYHFLDEIDLIALGEVEERRARAARERENKRLLLRVLLFGLANVALLVFLLWLGGRVQLRSLLLIRYSNGYQAPPPTANLAAERAYA